MRDEERMEVIEYLIQQRDKNVVDGEVGDYHDYDDFIFELNDNGHIDWMYGQARYVQELKSQIKRHKKEKYKNMKEKERYREALEKVIKSANAGKVLPHIDNHTAQIARKALAGDTND